MSMNKSLALWVLLAVTLSFAAPQSAKVRSVLGDVSLKKKGQGDWASLRVGAKVRHPRFGFGVVLAASGTSPTDRVDVRFADGSTRCLVIKFASLTVVG